METSSTCLSLLKVKTKTGKETKQLKNDVEHLLFKVKKKKKKILSGVLTYETPSFTA